MLRPAWLLLLSVNFCLGVFSVQAYSNPVDRLTTEGCNTTQCSTDACIDLIDWDDGCASTSLPCYQRGRHGISYVACVDIASPTLNLELIKLNVLSVEKFEYSSETVGVNWIGGAPDTTKGFFYNLTFFDMSAFTTSDKVTSFGISDIALKSEDLDNTSLTPRWKKAAFRNTNLDKLPQLLSSMKSVQTLDLSMNILTTLPSSLSGWTSIEELNLSQNLFKVVPSVIFSFSKLKKLDMTQCGTTDVHLTESDAKFLKKLDSFVADFTVTAPCQPGYKKQHWQGSFDVCVASSNDGTASDNAASRGGANASKRPTGLSNSNDSSSNGNGAKAKQASDKPSFLERSWWIILGGVVIIAVLVTSFIHIHHRRDKLEDSNNQDSTQGAGTRELSDPLLSPPNKFLVDIWNDPVLLEARIDYSALSLTKIIAHGNFGEVWLGSLNNRNVVIKQMRNDRRTAQYANAFVEEIKMMARLGHPRIVSFIGVAWQSVQTLLAVTEYMEGGDLSMFLASTRSQSCTWEQDKGTIAIDVAEGLIYLHSLEPSIIHRDLKSRNVMLDRNLNAKLSDFGISRHEDTNHTMTACVGTARWMAPEVITGEHYSEAADMYSFGVVLTELDTHKVPFSDLRNARGTLMDDVEIVQLVATGVLQPMFSESCPTGILQLGVQCLNPDPSARPTAMQASYALRQVLGLLRSDQSYLERMTLTL